MNFEVDTNQKKITLLSDCTLKELVQLKDWIGEQWEQWTVVSKVVEVQIDKWIPYTPIAPYPYPTIPYSPLQPYYTNCFKVYCTDDSITKGRYRITVADGPAAIPFSFSSLNGSASSNSR